MDTIDTDITTFLTVNDLVEAGRERRRRQEEAEAARRQREANNKAALEEEVVGRVAQLIPRALREFVYFHRWRDAIAGSDRWNAEVDICAPVLAPVRIKVYADCYYLNQEEREGLRGVMLYDRRGYAPYSILRFTADPGEDEAFVRTQVESEHDDLLEALAAAAEVGETYQAAAAEVQRMNQAEKPAAALPPEPVVIYNVYAAWRDTLKTAQGWIDRGLASTAQEYSYLVMAGALVDIAATLKGMTDEDGDLRVNDVHAWKEV